MNKPKVLLIGVGGFGRNHLRAWHELGMGGSLYVAEKDPGRQLECSTFNMPAERIVTDFRRCLDQVDVVDVVTPSDSHFALCAEALQAGKDVFVEKPMTMTSAEAVRLAELVEKTGRILQVGYYYRFHPLSRYMKDQIAADSLGRIRYLSGNFMGLKRARTDVGVTHTDAIHFIDLFNWLLEEPPEQAYAVTRDHFGRGMEDTSIVILKYPRGALGKVESGYIQPGRWRDKVVPNALTSKEIFVCGEMGTAEADFEVETIVLHRVRHEFNGVTWAPITEGSHTPNVGTLNPIQMVCAELRPFLECVESRRRPEPNVVSSGIVLAKVIEAIYQSSRQNAPIAISWSLDELEGFRPPSAQKAKVTS